MDRRAVLAAVRDRGWPEPAPAARITWFGDSPEQARELGELVARGEKTATAGLLGAWEARGRPMPEPGDQQVIVDWTGEPLALIELTEVRVRPFEGVDEPFARAEGEGDLSLDYWRRVHWAFFVRECERIGREPTPDMPVICMRFRKVG